jgi:hypothetical protein
VSINAPAQGKMLTANRRRARMKKFAFLVLIVLAGVGAYYARKMLKGDGGCCGWGGDKTDPWSSYTPPADDVAADVTDAAAAV